MKYPVGTKCYVVRTTHTLFKGAIVTVLAHGAPYSACQCGSSDHLVETDFPAEMPVYKMYGCCLCNLVPIGDPDAAVAKIEEEELSA